MVIDRTPRIPLPFGAGAGKYGIAILSKPEKMRILWGGKLRRVHSWGIPAVVTCPGAQFGVDTICGTCYANPLSIKERPSGKMGKRAGTYNFPAVQAAMAARYAWTQQCLMTEAGRDEWVRVMTEAVKWATNSIPFFRVHDSGDMFSASYVRMWARVIAALPSVNFWVPTRSWNVDKPGLPPMRRAMLQQTASALVELATLPNVAVRPSALHIDAPAPVIPGLHAGTGATRDHTPREGVCPAQTTNGNCSSCTACWLDKYSERSYPTH